MNIEPFSKQFDTMLEKSPDLVSLVERMIQALDDSTQGREVDPLAFFNHPALDRWLPQAKALLNHIKE